MGKRQSMVRRLLCAGLAGLCLGALGGPVAAQADTADIIAPQNSPADANDGWQAGHLPDRTLLAEHPRGLLHPGRRPPADRLHPVHRQAHDGRAAGRPGRQVLKDVRVDLPVGLSVNPQATPQCDLATFTTNPVLCPPNSVVGASIVTTALAGVVAPPVTLQVYNLVPSQGEPALFGFSALGSNIFLKVGRRMERGLPRGLHDRGAGGAARRRDPQEPPRLLGARRQRDLPDHPQHLPRPRPGRLRPHLLDLPAGRLGRGPRPRLPQRLEPLRGRPAAGGQADRLRAGAVQTGDRGDAGHRPHRLARRRRRST